VVNIEMQAEVRLSKSVLCVTPSLLSSHDFGGIC